MIGFRSCGGGGLDIRVTGIPAVTMVVEFGENELTVDSDAGQQSLTGFVSGFLRGTMRVHSKRVECIEVRLSPILTHSLLGVAPTDLNCAVVALEDLWGQRARWLREQLADAVTWDERFALTRSFLVRSHEPTRTPHPEVVASWERIAASRGQVKVGELAASCGWSRKRLWTRFESQIGLTPKRAAMLVRFRHAVDGLLAGRPAADVAVACGYGRIPRYFADGVRLCSASRTRGVHGGGAAPVRQSWARPESGCARSRRCRSEHRRSGRTNLHKPTLAAPRRENRRAAAVCTGTQLDGPGRCHRRRVHHRRGAADVSGPGRRLALIRDCATRFPGGRMMFDSIPHWFSRRTLKGLKLSARYTVPPMPFSMTADEGAALADRIPGVRTARDVPLRPGRGAFKVMAWPPLDGIRFLRRIRPSMTLLEFGP